MSMMESSVREEGNRVSPIMEDPLSSRFSRKDPLTQRIIFAFLCQQLETTYILLMQKQPFGIEFSPIITLLLSWTFLTGFCNIRLMVKQVVFALTTCIGEIIWLSDGGYSK
jgi:hypothetical protein